MADIQFDITLDLVEEYVPAENVTVVQEDYQSVKFVYTILNREQPVDLSGATDIVVSFVKPDGHIVLQNDGTLVNGKIELVANPQAFTYVGNTYFQVQYKIGTSIYNTRQAFLWVERGNTSCQTLSSTDFAPMLDQAIQAGQMLAGIDLQALIDSKVTAENAQADVDALELRVGALEVTIVGLDSRVDTLEISQATQDTAISGLQASQATQDTKIATLETGQAGLSSRVTSVEGNITTVVSEVDALQLTAVDHETRIDGLEASIPNLDPINTAISSLQAKDVEQDGRIGANEIAISAVQTKNTQQDTAIAGNATGIANLQAEQTTQNNRLTAAENKNAAQDSAIGDIQAKDTAQDAAISALQSSQATQDTDIAAIKVKNTQQDTAISANSTSIAAVDTKVNANKSAQDTVNSGVSGSLSNHTTRIESLEADATVDDARITNLEGDNTSNKNRISNVEGAIGVLNSDINSLQGNDAVQDARLNAIEVKNTTQDGQIATNSSAIAANKADADSKITGLTTRLGTAETDIVNLKAKDTQQDTRMTAIENKNDAQDTRMTTIEGVNTTQNTRLGTLETDNTSNKSKLATLETDNTSNKNRLTSVENKNTSQDTDIAGKVSKTEIYSKFTLPDGKATSINDTDLNNLLEAGQYTGQRLVNSPEGSTGFFYVEVIRYNQDTYRLQRATNLSGSTIKMYFRVLNNNIWTSWTTVADTTNMQLDIAKPNGDASLQANSGQDLLQTILDAGRGFRTFYAAGSALNTPNNLVIRGFSNMHGTVYGYAIGVTADNKVWSNFINGSTWLGWKCVTGNDKDGTANLPLTADGENFDSAIPLIATRRGNTVTVRGAIKAKTGTSGTIVVATIPADMRPIDNQVQYNIDHGGQVQKVYIGTSGNISLYAADRNIYLQVSYVVN